MEQKEQIHKRRVRYKGTHPRSYKEKYKRKNMISLCLNDDEFLKIEKINHDIKK